MPADSPQTCTAELAAALIRRDMSSALELLTDDAVFFYSHGAAVIGKDAFAALMTANWGMMEDYRYASADSKWIVQSDAACVIYSFTWSGAVRG